MDNIYEILPELFLKANPFLSVSPHYNMVFENLLDRVMDADKHIRYATVCDMEGKEVQTRIRDGVTRLLNEDETRETLHYAVSAWKSRNKFAPKIGKGKYVLAVYEKLRRLTLPLGDSHMLLVTWGTDGGQAEIIERIQNLLSGDYTRAQYSNDQL